MRLKLPKMLIASGNREPFDALEEERRPLLAHHALGDLRDFETRVHFHADALQIPDDFEVEEKGTQVAKGHDGTL